MKDVLSSHLLHTLDAIFEKQHVWCRSIIMETPVHPCVRYFPQLRTYAHSCRIYQYSASLDIPLSEDMYVEAVLRVEKIELQRQTLDDKMIYENVFSSQPLFLAPEEYFLSLGSANKSLLACRGKHAQKFYEAIDASFPLHKD